MHTRFVIRVSIVLGADNLDDARERCDFDLHRHCGDCWMRNAVSHLTLYQTKTYAGD